MASEIERSPSSHAAVLLFWMSSSTVPISRMRTGAPLRYVTIMSLNCSACCTVIFIGLYGERLLGLPQSTPVGRLVLAELIALATSSMPIPRDASARGSTSDARGVLPGSADVHRGDAAHGGHALGHQRLRRIRRAPGAAWWPSGD